MRGEGLVQVADVAHTRITPAYAGRSSAENPLADRGWDHPRLCGEKRKTCDDLACYLGSPPPMRGEGPDRSFFARSCRITPAYAGRSRFTLHCTSRPWDHPRLCGEKVAAFADGSRLLGSPPPMRGEAPPCLPLRAYDRITPAYAGRSLIAMVVFSLQEDHPRLCGEKPL